MPVWTRYPWLCGYLIAPASFYLVSQQANCYVWAAPLLQKTASPATLAVCWHFHFLRRALEVVFLNVYHGKGIPNERDSALEFLYYLIWGVTNGYTAACVAKATGGDDTMSKPLLPMAGIAFFCVGQAGNFYCHAHLRSLRPSTTDSKWVIPQEFPFSVLAAPHYTFEILSWIGYGLAAGLAPPSLFILGLSLVTLASWGYKRKQKYIKMYKDGPKNKDQPSPENRWALIPFVF